MKGKKREQARNTTNDGGRMDTEGRDGGKKDIIQENCVLRPEGKYEHYHVLKERII